MLLAQNGYASGPGNDDLASATVVTSLPFADTVSATEAANATLETNEVVCENEESWWYSFTPSITATYLITSEVSGETSDGTDNDIRMGIYTGLAHPLTEVKCMDDDGGAGWGEEDYVELTSGTTYYIRIAPSDASEILDVSTTIRAVNNWTGAVDDNWANANNWELGTVPTKDQAVIMPACPNDAVIYTGTFAVANQITLGGTSLEIEYGAALEVDSSIRYGIFINSENSILDVYGILNIDYTADAAIRSSFGVLNIYSTGEYNASDVFVGIYVDSESAQNIDGSVDISDAEGGILLFGNDTLYIHSNANITMDNIDDDGIYQNGESDAFVDIQGTVEIEDARYGIDIEEGNMQIGGTVDLKDIGYVGLDFSDDCELMVLLGGIVTIDDANYRGIRNVDGTNEGTITIDETGASSFTTCDNGFTNMNTITISNSGSDGIKTGDGTFTNLGTINISNVAKDGIDCGDAFINYGTIEIQNASEFAIKDGSFTNMSGGTVRTDGTFESSSCTFNSGSIIEPGVSVGCVIFNNSQDLSGVVFNVDINNTSICSDHDKVNINGNATITDAVLNLSGSHTPSVGDQITILEVVNSINSITGTFLGLSEGSNITFNGFTWSITYSGGDGNDIVLESIALPVEMISFAANLQNDDVLLNWETASELNNDYFEVEFSLNGVDFQKIGRVTGAGTTLEQQSYEFLHDLSQIDFSLTTETKLYYRLRQVDFDGQFEYSDIKQVSIELHQAPTVNIYPNPTTDFITIDNAVVEEWVYVLNTQGQIVKAFQIQSTSDRYSLSAFPSGTYYLKIGESVQKIVLQ
jgi:hypothetical protein